MGELLDEVVDNIKELFGYNRENYFFDAKMRLEREYQEQKIRVKQFALYREDVRDLVALTTSKMDSYITPSGVLLTLCILLLVEGDLPRDDEEKVATADPLTEPEMDAYEWLLWLYVISLAQAILYLMLSIWLAIHASVAAHSFGVRLLTQFVRLPVPDRRKLDAARTYAAEFEGQTMTDILRVPLWRKQVERMASALGEAAQAAGIQAELEEGQSNDAHGQPGSQDSVNSAANGNGDVFDETWAANYKPQVLLLRHVRLYRDLQANWQAHDAYARVCLALGTYTLVHAFAYYILGVLAIKFTSPLASIASAVVLSSLAFVITNLDLSIKSRTIALGAVLLMSGHVLTSIALVLYIQRMLQPHYVLVILIFVQHWVLIGLVTWVARGEQLERSMTPEERRKNKASGVALPTRFRMVLYLDVFGWIDDPGSQLSAVQREEKQELPPPPPMLFPALRDECWNSAVDIQRQLLVWEEALRLDTNMQPGRVKRKVAAVRREFMDVIARLPRADAVATDPDMLQGGGRRKEEALRDLNQAVASGPQTVPIWLRGEDYYYRPDTGEFSLVSPADARVSHLGGVREQVEVLKRNYRNLQVLRNATRTDRGSIVRRVLNSNLSSRLRAPFEGNSPEPRESTLSASAAPLSRGPGRAMGDSDETNSSESESSLQHWSATGLGSFSAGSRDGMRDSGNQVGQRPLEGQVQLGHSTHSSSPSRQPDQEQDKPTRGPSTAQVREFGGREAAQTDEMAVRPFYPRTDNRQEHLRSPGQVPWSVFCRSSCLLMIIWLVGTGWYCWMCALKIGRLNANTAWMEFDGGAQALALSPALYRQNLKVTDVGHAAKVRAFSMACHKNFGPTMLVASRFKVWELDVSSTAAAAPQHTMRESQSIHRCLARAPLFQSQGLLHVQLQCSSAGHCIALLHSDDQAGTVLRCPMRHPSKVADDTSISSWDLDASFELQQAARRQAVASHCMRS